MKGKTKTQFWPATRATTLINELYFVYSVTTGVMEFKDEQIDRIPSVLEITKVFKPIGFEVTRPEDKLVTMISPEDLDDYINSGEKCLTPGFLKIMRQFRNFQPKPK